MYLEHCLTGGGESVGVSAVSAVSGGGCGRLSVNFQYNDVVPRYWIN